MQQDLISWECLLETGGLGGSGGSGGSGGVLERVWVERAVMRRRLERENGIE